MNRLPSPDEILAWLRDNPAQTAKRDIARAFGLKGAAKVELKQLLAADGRDGPARTAPPPGPPAGRASAGAGPARHRPRRARAISGPSRPNGRARARRPRILLRTRRDDPALGAGDRLLGRMYPEDGRAPLAARVIRRIGMGPRRVLGIYHEGEAGGRIAAIDKRTDRDWLVAPGDRAGAREGELVEAEQIGAARGHGLPRARVVARLGDPSAPRSVSLIAIHEHGIPDDFPEEALAEAEAAQPVRARQARGPARAPLRHHRPVRRARPRRRGLRPARRRPGQPRRPRRLGRDRRRRRTTSAPAPRSTARRAGAATRPTSPTASCRCCPTGCPATSARSSTASTAPASPSASSSTPTAQARPPLRPRPDALGRRR